MLYAFTKKQELVGLAPLAGLEIRETDSPELMAALNLISREDALLRFSNNNKAFVAYWNGSPAAFGWMALGKARIGELNHEFVLPESHRYLWNFRTLAEFRGKGIYPRLLQHIMISELDSTECFWIMHAPENTASEIGIRKAGFELVSQVSVVEGGEVILKSSHPSFELQELMEYGDFINSLREQASCWNCSSPFLKNRSEKCCCAEKDLKCNGSLFQPSFQVQANL